MLTVSLTLLGVLLIPVVVGSLLPAGHVASASAVYTETPDRVWSAVSDVAGWPEWNRAVSVTLRPPIAEAITSWTSATLSP